MFKGGTISTLLIHIKRLVIGHATKALELLLLA